MNPPTSDLAPAPRENVLEYVTLVETLAQQQKLPASTIRSVLRGLFVLTTEGLKGGKSVRIRGLGMLKVREATGGAGQAARAPGKRVVLAAEKALKAAVEQ